MIRLTKELTLMSNLLVAATGVESTELDFNLARRSGVVINHIQSQVRETVSAGTITTDFVQEVDLDPDNVDVWGAAFLRGDVLDMDSSRLLSQIGMIERRVSAVGDTITPSPQALAIDYRTMPLEERPISITNLRHHLRIATTIGAGALEGLIAIRYVIVELSLTELGIINAGRR